MRNRPWPIIIFGFALILLPLANIFWNYIFFSAEGVSFQSYATAFVTNKSPLAMIESFALYPLAGIGVLLMRSWSYWGFVVVSTWMIARNTFMWTADPQAISLQVLLAFNGCNFAMLTYYLLPSMQRVFFDPKVRWWESQPRYATDLDGKIKINGGAFPCRVANISQGGAQLQTGFNFDEDHSFHLDFRFNNKKVKLPCKVVHHVDSNIYGIQFEQTHSLAPTISWVADHLRKNKARVINGPDPVIRSFTNWLSDLGHGRGFTPQIHQ